MTHPNGRTTHLGERAAHPDERIAPKAPTGAEAPSVCASEIARDASRRTSSRRQRAVAGAVAVCAAALIATSACFLFVPADHNDIGSLFATTTEAASQRGQDDAENADAPDGFADCLWRCAFIRRRHVFPFRCGHGDFARYWGICGLRRIARWRGFRTESIASGNRHRFRDGFELCSGGQRVGKRTPDVSPRSHCL